MDIGIAGTHHHAVIAVEQQIAVETVGPGLHRKEQAEQHRAMGDRGWRDRSALGVIFDIAPDPVHHSREQRAQKERPQQPVLDSQIGGQRKQIEADVPAEERIACAKRCLMEVTQEHSPIVNLSPADKHGENNRAAVNNSRPRQPMAHGVQNVRQCDGACVCPLEICPAMEPRTLR